MLRAAFLLSAAAACDSVCQSCLRSGGGTGCVEACQGCSAECRSCVAHGGGSGCVNDGRCRAALVRGTWIPTSLGASTADSAATIVRELAQRGVNRIYVDVWNNGKVYYQSPAAVRFAGAAVQGPDRLALFMDAVRQLAPQIQVYAWFEYGFMACYGSTAGNAFAEAADSQGWLLGEHSGFTWMHPGASVGLLKELVQDLLAAYPGVVPQLDDHFACPSAFSSCTRELMDSTAQEMSQVVRSLSPAPLDFAKSTLNVDWAAWASRGLFGEMVPQLYYSAQSSFQSQLQQTKATVSPAVYASLLVGVRVDGSGAPTSWSEAEQMLETLDSEGLGAVIWYANGIIDLYPDQFQQRWGPSAGTVV